MFNARIGLPGVSILRVGSAVCISVWQHARFSHPCRRGTETIRNTNSNEPRPADPMFTEAINHDSLRPARASPPTQPDLIGSLKRVR